MSAERYRDAWRPAGYGEFERGGPRGLRALAFATDEGWSWRVLRGSDERERVLDSGTSRDQHAARADADGAIDTEIRAAEERSRVRRAAAPRPRPIREITEGIVARARAIDEGDHESPPRKELAALRALVGELAAACERRSWDRPLFDSMAASLEQERT